ncbi:MAG TPA: hypothetical protein VG838_13425 [Opitutaceae bacterium]|nr:hypothetical protein [Lacunisphaera sp.]HWA10441.1 hypothetical protein [Opitutaceae bacterium]
MNPKANPELTVQTLMALRQEGDALRVITERLRVKEMGPADHIRTKHEVKAFVASGDATNAQELLRRAGERHATNQILSAKIKERQGQRMNQ